MEGMGYHIRWICESLQRLGFEFDSINAIGGGCKSALWPQIISDISGHPLHIVEHPLEAGAMAIAFAVAVGMGVYASMDEVDDLIAIRTQVEPNPAFERRYNGLYQQYREIYTALAPIYRRLPEIP
jgi:xylulokinase